MHKSTDSLFHKNEFGQKYGSLVTEGSDENIIIQGDDGKVYKS